MKTTSKKKTGGDGLLPSFDFGRSKKTAPAEAEDGFLDKCAAAYAKWVRQQPDTRVPGTVLAALYPAGGVAHAVAAGVPHCEPWMLAGFAVPAAGAAWVGTSRRYGTGSYARAVTGAAAGVPAWLGTAAATGVFDVRVLLGYTLAATGAWSAWAYSDVLQARRARKKLMIDWADKLTAVKLAGAIPVDVSETRLGYRLVLDVRPTGKRASDLTSSRRVAEDFEAALGLGMGRVRVARDPAHSGYVIVDVELSDPWAETVTHPILAGVPSPRRSILDAPVTIGYSPAAGEPIPLTVFDETGAIHTGIYAMTNGGKTTVFNVINEDLTQRVDVAVSGICLGKGTVPTFWGTALADSAGLTADGPDYDGALRILGFHVSEIERRSLATGGKNHVPTPQEPVRVLEIDELDELVGPQSPVWRKALPLVDRIHRRGRSAGVCLITAGQRPVQAYTGSKDAAANAGNTIVLRLKKEGDQANAIPGWLARGMPDMIRYAPGVRGVVLVVNAAGEWSAGRSLPLHDLDLVAEIAAARPCPYRGGVAPASPTVAAPTAVPTQEGDPVDPVDRLASRLVAEVEDALRGMPAKPAKATPLADLVAAQAELDKQPLPADAMQRCLMVVMASPGLSVREYAKRADLSKSTAHRALKALAESGLVVLRGDRYHAKGDV
jgi:DNA-binding transcriptional ArsR family regulator